MKVIAQIEKLDPDTGHRVDGTGVTEVSAEGADYLSAKAAVVIPDGHRVIGWIVPDHLEEASS